MGARGVDSMLWMKRQCGVCFVVVVAELELSCAVLRFASNFFDASTSLIVLLTIF